MRRIPKGQLLASVKTCTTLGRRQPFPRKNAHFPMRLVALHCSSAWSWLCCNHTSDRLAARGTVCDRRAPHAPDVPRNPAPLPVICHRRFLLEFIWPEMRRHFIKCNIGAISFSHVQLSLNSTLSNCWSRGATPLSLGGCRSPSKTARHPLKFRPRMAAWLQGAFKLQVHQG